MTTCNCCNKPSGRSAWCGRCGPEIVYQGDAEAGLAFHCPVHSTTIEIAISFELGEVDDGN